MNLSTIGEDIQIDEIAAQYDNVFLDTGAWKKNIIGIDGEDLTAFGLEFLVEVKSWMKDKPGSSRQNFSRGCRMICIKQKIKIYVKRYLISCIRTDLNMAE